LCKIENRLKFNHKWIITNNISNDLYKIYICSQCKIEGISYIDGPLCGPIIVYWAKDVYLSCEEIIIKNILE